MRILDIFTCLRKMLAFLNFRNFFIQQSARDASTQTPVEEFISQEKTRDSSTQTPRNDLRYLEQSPVASKTSEESRKRKILNVKNIKHGSDNNKLTKTETERKHPRCSVCKATDAEHLEVRHGKVMSRCCGCSRTYDNFNCLQMHIYDKHFKCLYCKVCQLKYSEMFSHARGGMCDMCGQDFECKYQLEEHYISVHKDFFETNCKICKRNLDGHSTSGKEVKEKYQCCVRECKIRTNSTICLNEHLYTHLDLKLFKCEVCGNHFKQPIFVKKHLYNDHPLCKSCGKRFLNGYFLNEHRCED